MEKYMAFTSALENTSALMQIYEGVKHTEISEEFILPDYLPDIKRIIKVSAKPKIDTKYVTVGKVEYEGDVVTVLLFVDRKALKMVDYPLLLTFVAFFIFIVSCFFTKTCKISFAKKSHFIRV